MTDTVCPGCKHAIHPNEMHKTLTCDNCGAVFHGECAVASLDRNRCVACNGPFRIKTAAKTTIE